MIKWNSFFLIFCQISDWHDKVIRRQLKVSRGERKKLQFRGKFVLTLVQMSKTPSKTIRALMVRLIITFAVGAATRQRSVLSPWEKTSTRYLRTRHPGRNERSIASRSPSTTERGKSSERPVSGSARESVFLSIATLAPSCRDREERRRWSKRYDNPSLPRSPVFAGLSGRNRHVVDIRPQIAEHPS